MRRVLLRRLGLWLVGLAVRRARRHPSELSDPETLDDVEDLRAFLTRTRRRRAPELDVEVAATLAAYHWCRYRYAHASDTVDDLVEALSLWRRLAEVDAPTGAPRILTPLFDPGADLRTPTLPPEELAALMGCVDDLFDRGAEGAAEWIALEAAITLARHAMALGGAVDDMDRDTMADLARALDNLAWHTGDEEALDRAVAVARAALHGASRRDPERLRWVAVLGMTLARVGVHRHDERALRDASALLRRAVRAAAADDPYRTYAVSALLYAICGRLGWLDADDRLAPKPAALRRLLAMLPDGTPGRDGTVENVALALWWRYLWLPGGVDMDVLPYTLSLFADLYERDPERVPALLVPLFDPAAPEMELDEDDLYTLVTCASDLYEYADEAEDERRGDSDRGVVLARRAAALAERLDTITPETRAELARVLLNTFHRTGDTALLAPTRRHARIALAGTPPEHDERLGRIGVLGGALAEIADAHEDEDALNEAIALLQPAVHAAPPDHPGQVPAALALFRALTLRSGRSTGVSGMGEAARDLRALLDHVPEDFPTRDEIEPPVLGIEAHHLINIGDLSGAEAVRGALDRAIERLTPGTEAHDRSRLLSAMVAVSVGVIGGMLMPGPLLATYRAVFDSVSTLDPLERATNLNLLCTYLLEQADPAIHGPPATDRRVLDECLDLLGTGLTTVPKGSAEYRDLRAQFGAVLLRRYRATGDRDDLERATEMARERWREVTGRRSDPTDVSTARSELAHALREQHLLTGTHNTYEEAMTLLRVSVADPEQSLIARAFDGYAAADLAVRTGRFADAADVYAAVVGLAVRGAWRTVRRSDREVSLSYWAGAANEAAATAVLAGDPRRAVTMLEHGRAILLHQELDARGNGLRLRAERPDLADRLERIEEAIERTADPRRRRRLGLEWRGVLAEIRARPGFARFLHPPDMASLDPAEGQTAVLVNPADAGSHALIVTTGGIRVIPLPGLVTAEVRERVTAFNQALAGLTRPGGRAAATETLTDTLDWLWHSTAAPVLAALGHHDTPPDGSAWPRIHWCPTWMLTVLPIHAAAARDPAGPGRSVLDRVVSSYTVSLNALRHVSVRADPALTRRSLLLVSVPEAPGLPPLPGARREAAGLAGLGVPTTVLTGPAADRARVSAAMREHAWAHFACHTSHDLTDPSRGRLLLHDYAREPFTVVEISRLRLEEAQLAYLSACDTARGGLRLPDEAIHVGGALQLAGYQHVIATLWAVNDRIAARMTERVYGALLDAGGHTLQPGRAAWALHEATRALRRRYPHEPTLWAGYVHFGP